MAKAKGAVVANGDIPESLEEINLRMNAVTDDVKNFKTQIRNKKFTSNVDISSRLAAIVHYKIFVFFYEASFKFFPFSGIC